MPHCIQLGCRRGCLLAQPTLLHCAHLLLDCYLPQVDVLGEASDSSSSPLVANALQASRRVNEALLHRAATGEPFSVWKYAMTLDGKIATRTGHSAWVSGTWMHRGCMSACLVAHAPLYCMHSGPAARQRVYAERARSDAIIVGGNTLRRDNPHLTTRQEGGHTPMRVVISRSLDLPEVRSSCFSNACSSTAHPCAYVRLLTYRRLEERPHVGGVRSTHHGHGAA